MSLRRLLILTMAVISLTACTRKLPLGDPELPYPPAREPVVGDILHLPTGVYVSEQTLLDHAVRERVVFVGETHDNPASHRLERIILAALQEHNPGNVTLAMEMFVPSQQQVLDRWSDGELSEKDFLKEVDWYGTWSMNFAFYRPLLQYCREHKIKILALNAEQDIKKLVSHSPLEDLPEAVRQKLPQMDFHDPYQRAMVQATFKDHAMGSAMLASFQRVQTLWDETMASNLADYLKKMPPSHQVEVIAGGNHVRYGFGIPRRMFRRVPASYLLVGSNEIDIPADKQDRLMNVVKPDYPMPPYDFVMYTRYEDLPSPGVKLGVMFEPGAKGLTVQGVMPGSAAAAAGVESGDILIGIDDSPINEPFDLIYALQQKQVGDSAQLKLWHADQEQLKEVQFSQASQQPHGTK